MSRGGWDDDRETTGTSDAGPEREHDSGARAVETPDRDVRQQVRGPRGRDYQLRESEWRTLETVGTFRVVAATDVVGLARDESVTRADLRHLSDVRLIQQKTAIVDHTATRLVVLTRDGKALLEQHRADRQQPEQQRAYAQRQERPERQAQQGGGDGEPATRAPREGGTRERGRRNGNTNGGNGNSGNGNGFAAPDFLNEALSPRFEMDSAPESDAVQAVEAQAEQGEEAAPKRRRTRRPRGEAAPAEA